MKDYRPKYPDSPFIHVADLVVPGTDKTYRELNAEKSHKIPIGALVEVSNPDVESDGIRLFVVHHGRDCDQTPLYYLSPNRDDTEQKDSRFRNSSWDGGYSEESLTIINREKANDNSN